MGFIKMIVLSNVELFNKQTIELLFEYFYNDFIHNNTYLTNGNKYYKIDVKKDKICNCQFNGNNKPERFWHIITKKENEKSKCNNPCPSPENRRIYDPARAKRIHWIKPIIEEWLSNPNIVHFYEKIKGKETLHIWHTKYDFVIILRKETHNSECFLVSTYLVHKNQKQRYKKRLKRYKNIKPIGFEWF